MFDALDFPEINNVFRVRPPIQCSFNFVAPILLIRKTFYKIVWYCVSVMLKQVDPGLNRVISLDILSLG